MVESIEVIYLTNAVHRGMMGGHRRRTTMAKALFSLPRFTNDDAARKHLEALRWPSGPVCPHCGGTERNSRLQGEAHRPGVIFCGDCRTQFTVTVGTVF